MERTLYAIVAIFVLLQATIQGSKLIIKEVEKIINESTERQGRKNWGQLQYKFGHIKHLYENMERRNIAHLDVINKEINRFTEEQQKQLGTLANRLTALKENLNELIEGMKELKQEINGNIDIITGQREESMDREVERRMEDEEMRKEWEKEGGEHRKFSWGDRTFPYSITGPEHKPTFFAILPNGIIAKGDTKRDLKTEILQFENINTNPIL